MSKFCDVGMAERLADELFAALPPRAKDMWLSGKDSCRCFLPYRVSVLSMNGQHLDYESLQAASGVLYKVVPVVCDVKVHQKTAELAVKQVLEKMEVPAECCDDFSIQRQAYMLRVMLSHLQSRRVKVP